MSPTKVAVAAADLLRWYDRHRRRMPWRALPGTGRPDPYQVWLSEVMLQQTTVAAVTPRFERFLTRFPTVEALAAADEASVMGEWAGLGYYARARNLHACARRVVELGGFPDTVEGLRALPGIGAYTASSVAAIAFDVPVVPVDGNVERVAARIACIEAPLPGARPMVAAVAGALGADPDARARPGDFAQALFDLGATICTPAAPGCALCPWQAGCQARRQGMQDRLPRKTPRTERPLRHGAQFWLEDAEGQVLLHRRPPRGLLGGMLGLPGTPWRAEPWPAAEALAHAPQEAEWRRAGVAEHGFTHFQLRMEVYAARVQRIRAEGELRMAETVDAELPTAMRRCAAVARDVP